MGGLRGLGGGVWCVLLSRSIGVISLDWTGADFYTVVGERRGEIEKGGGGAG